MLRQHPSSTLFPYTTLFRSHSVTPGRTSWRRNCSLEYSGKYSINKGRGPTRLMSPLSTFQSSGNSSRLVARRKLPKGVMRCSSGSGLPCLSVASSIVRNLIISNGLPFRPGRVWRKNTGAPSLRQIKRATKAKTGASNKSPSPPATISNNLFSIGIQDPQRKLEAVFTRRDLSRQLSLTINGGLQYLYQLICKHVTIKVLFCQQPCRLSSLRQPFLVMKLFIQFCGHVCSRLAPHG